jgi:hypothetical protein
MSADIPAELPNIADARLPATYESAKRALAECSRIDECQNWSDKAAALASYARQARDDTLFNFATRIKARALDRCGELRRRIPASPGGRPETKDVADLSLSPRQQAAQDAKTDPEARNPTCTRPRTAEPGTTCCESVCRLWPGRQCTG